MPLAFLQKAVRTAASLTRDLQKPVRPVVRHDSLMYRLAAHNRNSKEIELRRHHHTVLLPLASTDAPEQMLRRLPSTGTDTVEQCAHTLGDSLFVSAPLVYLLLNLCLVIRFPHSIVAL